MLTCTVVTLKIRYIVVQVGIQIIMVLYHKFCGISTYHDNIIM